MDDRSKRSDRERGGRDPGPGSQNHITLLYLGRDRVQQHHLTNRNTGMILDSDVQTGYNCSTVDRLEDRPK